MNAQESTSNSDNYLERNPIYDYVEVQLNSTDTIPDFESKTTKLKVTGTIYKSDGVTPAKDVILFIEQADENGDFDLRESNEKRYVHHRGWVKTDADGQYTFYTFVPGNDRRYNQLQQLFPIIKEPSKPAYELASLLFDDDPLLTKLCRKRMAKKGDPTRVLKPTMVDGLLVAQKDIVLENDLLATK
jgi:protocatechuate 3,4-dioxygenase beta subunit